VTYVIIVPRVWHAPIVKGLGKMTEEKLSAKVRKAVRRKIDLALLRSELEHIIKKVDVTPLQKEFLRLRWLDQVLWMEDRANNTKALYYILRLTTIVGGVIIPALVSVSLPSGDAITWVVFVLSLVVAISAALEGFLRPGEQWRHYRTMVELLKNEGWLFFQHSGRYDAQHFPSRDKAYATFAHRVERWNRLEVGEYITEVVRDKGEDEDKDQGNDEDKDTDKDTDKAEV
jgi:Protein of unknown function (DUF4231)